MLKLLGRGQISSSSPPFRRLKILLLLGRDVLSAHKARQQVNEPHDTPFAQCLDLGWVVIGEACMDDVHKPTIYTFKTRVLDSSVMHVKETQPSFNRPGKSPERLLGRTVFSRTDHDNKPAPSIEDILFLKIMETNVYRDDANNWVAPEQRRLTYYNVHKPHSQSRTSACTNLCLTVR